MQRVPKTNSFFVRSVIRPLLIHARLVAAIFLAIAVLFGLPASDAGAHAELKRSAPSQDAILAAPPENVQFWFTERISTDPTPPAVTVFDEDGNKLTTTSLTVDPADPYHMTADVSGFVTGTYTVSWTVQSADDGHTLSGTFGFRIGTGRAPGAATVSAASRPATQSASGTRPSRR